MQTIWQNKAFKLGFTQGPSFKTKADRIWLCYYNTKDFSTKCVDCNTISQTGQL